MREYRNYKEHLIEKLKDDKYAAAYLKACLDESFETQEMGIFQLAVRDIVEARGGMSFIAEKMNISRQSFYKSLSRSGKPRFSTLANTIKTCGIEIEFHGTSS